MRHLRHLAVAVTLAAVIPVSTASYAATTGKAAVSTDEKQAKSKECSAEADKQGLHGKARKAFRSKCKRGRS